MRIDLSMYGSIDSSPYEDLANIGGDDVRRAVRDAVRHFLEDMGGMREVAFRADVRAVPANPEFRAALFTGLGELPGPAIPAATLMLRGEVNWGIDEDDYLIGPIHATERVMQLVHGHLAPYIDQGAVFEVDIALQADPSDGFTDMPDPWPWSDHVEVGLKPPTEIIQTVEEW